MTDVETRPEEVGQILIKVQDDLRQLRENLTAGDGASISIEQLQSALSKTEQGLQHRAEQMLSQLNNQVQTLPSADAIQPPGFIALETTWDLRKQTQGQQRSLALRAVYNPHSQSNRNVLNDNFGIQLPLIPQKREKRPAPKPVMGSTIEPLAVLPKANRVDAQLAPPPISEDDARKGILSLIERGLIPPAAQGSTSFGGRQTGPSFKALRESTGDNGENAGNPAPPPVHSFLQPNHLWKVSCYLGFQSEGENTGNHENLRNAFTAYVFTNSASVICNIQIVRIIIVHNIMDQHKSNPEAFIYVHIPLLQPPPTTPASGDFKMISHRFAVQNGRIRDTTSEFLSFKQHYCLTWGRLADLAEEFELEIVPSLDDLLSCIVNRDDVENIIYKPGRRFKGPNGRNIASAKIQATWKMYRERSTYLEYRRRKWAAGVIAISWIMHIKMAKVRHQLKQVRLDNLDAFRTRAKKFARSWDRIKKSKRVVIHIPSLDPNVDVIFISPVPLSEETLQYYSKLLGLKSAIDSGNVEDQGEFAERYKIIVPEAIKSFPTHRMCLSTLLKYSPQTMLRIKNLIRGREAYMMTNVPHVDDLDIANYLEVPIFAPEPEVAHLYSTKSGCKRIFASAKVDMPPSEYDIYSLGLLDDEFDGRGIAYCDITEHLKCYRWALKEQKRYGDKWSKKWAQEPVFIKILSEIGELLEEHSTPVNTKVYSTWDKFLTSFLSKGGIIEACPPSDSITTLTVDMLIEPNGTSSIISCGDQIHADTPFSCWGVSVPQASVEPELLNKCCFRIADACKSRGIMGYFAVDFVTFIDPHTMEQQLWALDISLQYSDSLAMFQLMSFVSNGTLNTRTHVFDVPPPKQEAKKRRRRLHGTDEDQPLNTNRFGVMSTRLLHTNLSVVHYSVFFQMCRAHGIGYDIKEKQGTVFTLIDSFNREKLGMLTVGETLQGALASFARNLSVIHQEISAPNMQGETNFQRAIGDIEGILGTTIQNADEEETDDTPEPK
ncbi:IQCH-like protein [Mya arenaria]|uniref:IQCH-like protein n=1 Tax=Mya arenaria TaxID=6604 RepID=A0ABY7EC84_MYAAR|nr:IQCH-like protein [Mya arenaria]